MDKICTNRVRRKVSLSKYITEIKSETKHQDLRAPLCCKRQDLKKDTLAEHKADLNVYVRKKVGAYGLETLQRKVATAVNIPAKQKVYGGLTSLDFDQSQLLKEEGQKRTNLKRRQLRSQKETDQTTLLSKRLEESSLAKLSATLLHMDSVSTSQGLPVSKETFPKRTFTLENAPTCRTFCMSRKVGEQKDNAVP